MTSNRRTYTKELLTEACENSDSVLGVMRYLDIKPAGGTHALISRRIKEYEIEFPVNRGKAHAKGSTSSRRKSADEILRLYGPSASRVKAEQLRRAMLEIGIAEVCSACGIEPEWNGEPLRFQVDHIDGNWNDSRPQNVRFLCPNCHTQTETYGKKLQRV